MDVHPTKNGMYRYWSIPIWSYRSRSLVYWKSTGNCKNWCLDFRPLTPMRYVTSGLCTGMMHDISKPTCRRVYIYTYDVIIRVYILYLWGYNMYWSFLILICVHGKNVCVYNIYIYITPLLLGARLFTNISPIYDPKWINFPYMEHMIWDSFKYVHIYIYICTYSKLSKYYRHIPQI